VCIANLEKGDLLMRGSLPSWSWCRSLSVVVAGAVLCIANPARAGIIVSVESVSATAGTTGNTLEVDVQNTGSTTVNVAAFSFELTVAASSGVTFTGADYNTTQTYIFAGNSFEGPNIVFNNTGTTLDAFDLAVSGSTALGPGSIFGLGLVSFDVASSAPTGAVTVSLTPYPSTSLTAPDLSNIPINTLNNGTITISGSIVPEPSALFSASLGILGGAWLIWRRQRTTRPRRG
jgi:hypothetical protein